MRFSDAEIIDTINTIVAQLIVEFKLNKAQQPETSPLISASHEVPLFALCAGD
ncbi:hypothetical protein BN341_1970 [Helicobacter heilmannii ASB1.4]|uniref:Uncharacterized protein n=1 Tax=Helicobacter heilmannii TaxID=35817 RepID=A0A0K2Y782_HELHE|nr:hypothetical protein BN341_1970 [Helicobacter heilmannii ASB1.4]CRI33987.1 hypothetical protein HHE01_16730 [Helicobacter heilmannii]